MKVRIGVLACCLTAIALGQRGIPGNSLFPVDQACACIKTRAQTDSVESREVTRHGRVFQVFLKRGTSQELFRVDLGQAGGPETPRLWNHGLAVERDLDGDGQTDFSWYGGDDTSEVMYLFLSSPNGYRRVDVIKTVQSAWKVRHHTAPPDLAAIGGDYSFDFSLAKEHNDLAMLATVHRLSEAREPASTDHFRIPQARFAR